MDNKYLSNKIKLLKEKDIMSDVLKKHYGKILFIFSLLILIYVAYIFLIYNYLTINGEIQTEDRQIKIKKELIDQVIEKINKKDNINESTPTNLKNPFSN